MDKPKAYALLVKPNTKPSIIHIEDTEESIKSVVGGEFERIYFPNDEVSILFNKDGVINNRTLNRVIRKVGIKEVDMTYLELTSRFYSAENAGTHITGYITFTEDSFTEKYPLEARTYIVSSNNKAFMSNMSGYSIYGTSLDGSDKGIRLENYMADEFGGKNGWKIERCYVKEEAVLESKIVADNFLVCYTPNGKNRLLDIPQELVDKYYEQFKMPDSFTRNSNGNIVVINKKAKSDIEMDR